jgi:hypothetical protein
LYLHAAILTQKVQRGIARHSRRFIGSGEVVAVCPDIVRIPNEDSRRAGGIGAVRVKESVVQKLYGSCALSA